MTKAWMIYSVVSWSNFEWILLMFISWLKVEGVNLFIWNWFLRVLSIRNLRLWTWSTDSTLVLPMAILVEIDSIFFIWSLAPNIINSVFSSLRLSIFADIHLWISAIHPCNCLMHCSLAPALDGLKARYRCWSSAYRSYVTACLLQIFPRGVVYSVNNIGPYMLPCGTPHDSGTANELASPTTTFWSPPDK